MMSTDVTPTERATAVLQTLQQALGGMAAAIPEPALAGPLGYFADAAGWAFHSLQAAERWQANEKILDELTGQARGLLEQAGHPLPAGDPDDVAATLAGERREFVLRQVPPGQPDDSLAPEYAVLRHVWTPDLPIAEPLWLEETDALGGPFFASRKATGTTYGTVEGAHKAVPESFCHDLSGFLARLHS